LAVEDADRDVPSEGHKVSDVGRYRLIAELARGGMGIVYLALVRGPGGFNKLFCVKVLKDHMAEDPKLVAMFLDEARLAAKLNHPNVVQTIEVGSDAGQHFIAMEYLEGQSVHALEARGRRKGSTFPLAYHLHVLVQLLEGLQYAHSVADFDGTPLRLVHRDVSPHNVMVTYDGQVKILDFGIAKALGSTSDTRTGALKGKVAYMAPEQAAGEPLDRRADVFAVGVMLWEAATGQRMWNRSLNDLQILHALMKGAIPRPRDARADVDPRLERIILKATAESAADRYQTAGEMQADLEACVREMGPPSVGARDVGKLVSEAFAEERATIRSVIEEQLGLLRGVSSGKYGTIDLPLLSGPVPGTPSGAGSSPHLEEPTTVETYRSVSGVRGTGARDGAAGQPGAARFRVAPIAIALALVAIGVVVVALLVRPSAREAPAQSVPSAITPSAAVGTVPPPVLAVASESPPVVAQAEAGASPPNAEATSTASARPRSTSHPTSSPPTSGPGVAHATSSQVATVASQQPAPPPTSTARVRQQIDTSNPYGH
jgi:eukaryotic-like serine/threonine-protein kinase